MNREKVKQFVEKDSFQKFIVALIIFIQDENEELRKDILSLKEQIIKMEEKLTRRST